ncbi:hypothetical protein AGMMS50239_27910 [Bacteroidia bacterium]|nr:hypothetical protein AGMMS50239_27910 [Bacteroidia bacterium]
MKTINIIKYLAFGGILSFTVSCDKDSYYKDASNDRQILWASAPGQIGGAIMPNKNALDLNNTITLVVMPDVDIQNLPVSVAISPKASVTPTSGTLQNFANGPVKYTVTSETGKTREFEIEVSIFEEIFNGRWKITTVDIKSEMEQYGLPRWPAPGMGQRVGEPIMHNPTTLVYNPPADGVELDNKLTFDFQGVNAAGNTSGILVTDLGADGKSASSQIVLDFLTAVNLTDEIGYAIHYPDDFFWLPAGNGVTWIRDINNRRITFIDGNVVLSCNVTIVDNDHIKLQLPDNPNQAAWYSRPQNGWKDRYDFAFFVEYTLERMN